MMPTTMVTKPLKKTKAWVFYVIPQKQGGWSNFLSFQYSTK